MVAEISPDLCLIHEFSVALSIRTIFMELVGVVNLKRLKIKKQ